MRIFKLVLVLFLAGLVSFGCKKNSTSSSVETTTTTTISAASAAVTSQTLPADLAISSSTETTAASSANISYAIGDGGGKQDHDAKKERMKGVMDAKDKTGCYAVMQNIGSPPNSPTCYGPSVNYIDHPDSTGGTTDGQLPSGDLGLWTSTEGTTGQACAAAKLNQLVSDAAQRIDMALGATAAMLCIAKQEGKELPAIGEEVDMASTMTADADVASKGGMTVSAAKLTRSADTAEGKASYTSNITFSVTPPGRSESETISVSLKHVPLDDTNATYQGIITVVKTGKGGTVQAPPAPPKAGNIIATVTPEIAPPNYAVTTTANALSVVYVRSATEITYKMISAEFDGGTTSANMFNSTTGEVNAANAGGTTGWTGNLNIALATVKDDGNSKLAYAWQAGSGDGYTRNFNVTTTKTGTALSGDAYFGFAENASNAAPKLKIQGMICNWAGPGNSGSSRKTDASWALVQKQQMALDLTTGIWKPSGTDKITFAPAKDCDWAGTGASRYGTDSPPTTGTVTNNLELMTNFNFTLPTEPTAPK